MSPHAKVSFRDGEHTYIMRLTNSSYPVAWLIAEEEEEDSYGLSEEDYSEEDNSAWNECDNYILRSSVSLPSVLSLTLTLILLSMPRLRYLLSSQTATRPRRTRTSSLRTPMRTTGLNKFRSSET